MTKLMPMNDLGANGFDAPICWVRVPQNSSPTSLPRSRLKTP